MTKPLTNTPACLAVRDRRGQQWIDLALGAVAPLGAGDVVEQTIRERLALAWSESCGMVSDNASSMDAAWRQDQRLACFQSAHCVGSTDQANELALWLARSSGARDGYRVLTLLGSRHGASHTLRSASGRPEWQTADGPLSPGFRHVSAGSKAALEKAIDDSVVAVILSPIDWSRGGRPFDPEYLQAVQSLCREHSLALIVDETLVAPGVSGDLGFWRLAGLEPDWLTLGTGWFFGLSGGLVLGRTASAETPAWERGDVQANQAVGGDASERWRGFEPWGWNRGDSHLLWTAFHETLRLLQPILASESTAALTRWHAQLQELKSGFDFVRVLQFQGWWATISLDIPACELLATCERLGIRLPATGDSTVLLCPPVTCQPEEVDQTVKLIRQTLEMIETAATADTSS